jgi:uncharacterized protein YjdB
MKIKPFALKQLQNLSQKLSFSPKMYFFIFGIASTVWFLMRVLPKPSRAGYPCVRAAAPVASAFVLYLISLTSSLVFFQRFAKYLRTGKISLAALFLVFGLLASIVALLQNNSSVNATAVALESANIPMGNAKGINPGRVVWIYNPYATNSASTNAYGDGYFTDTNTNQNEVDRMLEAALLKLTGQTTVAGAWDAIFKYHNQTRGKGSVTYTSSESVFIKINATSTWYENINSSFERVNNGYYAISETSPQVILAVLRQLVNTVGIPESKIYVGDPLKHIYQDNYTKWHNEFPDVHYLDYNSTNLGREKVVKSSTAIVKYSDRGAVLKTTAGNIVYQDSLYSIFETMEYMINIPNLKAHEYAGVSMFGKNHFGSQTRSDASHLHIGLVRPSSSATLRNTYGQYRVQVDLMTHKLLGKKNLFYLMDALYCSDWSVTKPSKWQIAPFNNDWTSSLFLSQDPVAIESVGFDFLYAQYDGSDGKNNYPHLGAVDDYLHQLADSTQWPTGITYDPENDGTSIGYSQGVHEHWNNATEKKYSRNLGTGYGIELIQDFMSAETIPVTGVTISPVSLTLVSGSTSALTAAISPANATNRTVTWSSGNTSVATISSSGVVTAVASGTATITVTTNDGGKTATCAVTVTVSNNLALNKTTTSSSDESTTLTANYATDGDHNSRWSSAFSDPQWIYVDLGAPYNITRVKLFWEAAYGSSYKIQVSTDASSWTDVYSTATGDGATDDLSIAASQGRYVRMYGTSRGTEYGYSIYEFEVYGDAIDTQAPTAPTGLNSPSQTQTSISLAWTASTDNIEVTGYDIYKDGVYIASTAATSYTIGDLSAATSYNFTVKAKDAAGNYSDASNAITVSTLAISVTGVALNSSGLILTMGSTSMLTATISPANATNQSVSWTSDNTNIATVNSSGVVTAVSAGLATITVTTQDSGKTASCAVTIVSAIRVPVTGVTLSSSSLLLIPGQTSALTATILPSDATNKAVTWASDNTAVAAVDANGTITALAEGSANITVTTTDGSKTATCMVTVTTNIAVSGISMNTNFLSLTACQTASLTATVFPEDATNKTVLWTSDNTGVATVDATGIVKAIATGIANITATTQDGGKTASCKVIVTAQTLTGVSNGVSGTITCKKKSVTLATLSGTGYSNYQWSGPNSFSSTAKSPSVSTPGIYTLTAKDTVNKCTVTAITNVLQNILKPNARASSNGTLSCGTKTVSLKVTTASANTQVTWDGQTTGVNPVTMQWPGTYFVTTKDTVNGCTKRDSVTVNQYITYNPVQFYNNTFSTYANGTIADNNTNGWTLDRSKISGVRSTYVLNTTPKFFAIYSKRITAQQLGAEGIWMSKVMTVSGKPNFQIGVKISTEGTFTSSDYVKLYYKLDGGSEILWDSRTGSLGTVDFRSSILNANTVQIIVKLYTTVKASGTVSNQYIEQYQLYIQDCGYPLAVYSSASGAINCANPSVTLHANSSHAGATYKWSGPNSYTSTAQYPVVSVPGTYTVTASMPTTASSSVASSTATGTVTVTQSITTPGASVVLPDTISSQKKFVALSGSSPTSGVYFSWAGPNGFASSQQNPVVTATGAYTLTVINPVNGCSSSATVNVLQNTTKAVILEPIATNPADNSITRNQPALELYPNPARNLLFLKTSGINTIVSVKILDIRGNIINLPSEGNGFYLNVLGLSSGLYILVVETDKCIFKKKFIRE